MHNFPNTLIYIAVFIFICSDFLWKYQRFYHRYRYSILLLSSIAVGLSVYSLGMLTGTLLATVIISFVMFLFLKRDLILPFLIGGYLMVLLFIGFGSIHAMQYTIQFGQGLSQVFVIYLMNFMSVLLVYFLYRLTIMKVLRYLRTKKKERSRMIGGMLVMIGTVLSLMLSWYIEIWALLTERHNIAGDIKELFLMITVFSVFLIIVALLMAVHFMQKYQREFHQARIDGHTKAYNRNYGMKLLKESIAEASFTREKSSLVVIDFDNLKEINDDYGHNEGDYLLEMVIDRLKQHIRYDDYVIRYGGDEFLLFLKKVDYLEAKKIMKRMARDVESASEFLLKGYEAQFSYGISLIDGSVNDMKAIIEIADMQMYKYKRARKEASDNNEEGNSVV